MQLPESNLIASVAQDQQNPSLIESSADAILLPEGSTLSSSLVIEGEQQQVLPLEEVPVGALLDLGAKEYFPGTKSIDAEFLCSNHLANSTMVESLPQLHVEASLSSDKPREPTDVTLVTQLSFERLYMLEGQCNVWHGVISAAVYIALVQDKAVTVELNSNQDPRLTDMSEILRQFEEFHSLAESKGFCKLDLILISHEVESVWLSALYPVNSMRNRALANARTDIVLLMDVDFWPSAELSEVVQRPGKYASLKTAVDGKNAIVLPAFETGEQGDVGVEIAREVVIEGKDTAIVMFWDGRIRPFHTANYKQGHRATDFKKWLTATKPYRIRYEEGYEPYVMVARKYVPWYDERFVGYRKNKVVHLLHLAQTGVQFIVHPRAFSVHSPHPRARSWSVTHKTGLWDQLAELYSQVKSGLESSNYIPASMYSCDAHVMGPFMSQDEGTPARGGWA